MSELQYLDLLERSSDTCRDGCMFMIVNDLQIETTVREGIILIIVNGWKHERTFEIQQHYGQGHMQ